jgi:hypothetical protein
MDERDREGRTETEVERERARIKKLMDKLTATCTPQNIPVEELQGPVQSSAPCLSRASTSYSHGKDNNQTLCPTEITICISARGKVSISMLPSLHVLYL